MILITGANGFVGSYLTEQLLKLDWPVCATGKGDCRLPSSVNGRELYYEMLDFTDPFAVHDLVEKLKPSIIVHAGAMGKPDECETNQWAAHQVNVEGTIHLAQNAKEIGARLLFLSTDFVFNGETGMYTESDPLAPVNFYGRTKLEAEMAVQEFAGSWSIVRTVLVYGSPREGRPNLLSILREKLMKAEGYRVVDDQFRTPTYVGDLVDGIVKMIEKNSDGLFHLCGDELMTPYDMACRAARFWKLPVDLIQRVSTSDLQHPAARPVKTGLSIEKAVRELGFAPRNLEQGLLAMDN